MKKDFITYENAPVHLHEIMIAELESAPILPMLESSIKEQVKLGGVNELMKKYYWLSLMSLLFTTCLESKNPALYSFMRESYGSDFMFLLETATDIMYQSRGVHLGFDSFPDYQNCDVETLTQNCQKPVDINQVNEIAYDVYTTCLDIAKTKIDFNERTIANLRTMIFCDRFGYYELLANVLNTCLKKSMTKRIENFSPWMLIALIYQISTKIYFEINPEKTEIA